MSNKILFVGDLHGNIRPLSFVDQWAKKQGITSINQVGDFGALWPGAQCQISHYFNKRNSDSPAWIFNLGNHENWDRYDEKVAKLFATNQLTESTLIRYQPGLSATQRVQYLPQNGGMLFIAGAVSSDAGPGMRVGLNGPYFYPGRIQGVDWWAQEAPTQIELQLFMDLLEDKKPMIVVSHDGFGAHDALGPRTNPKSNLPMNYVAQNLEKIWELSSHKPRYWFYGHHHKLDYCEIEETTFACCGKHGQGWILDMDDLEIGISGIPQEGGNR